MAPHQPSGFEDAGEGFAELVRLVRPDSGFEKREAFRKLFDCVEDALDRIRNAADSAARLTNQLLAFSRKQILESQPTDLGGAVGADLVKAAAKTRSPVRARMVAS